MNINIICVGKIKERFFCDAINEYKKRLSAFTKVNIIEVKDEKIPDRASDIECEQILKKEGDKIAQHIKGGYLVALCIEGKLFSSEQIANEIANAMQHDSTITFIIGGSLGLLDCIKQAANCKMSFGKITLPHQLMRVVLLEQIYRAFKINNNQTYHK